LYAFDSLRAGADSAAGQLVLLPSMNRGAAMQQTPTSGNHNIMRQVIAVNVKIRGVIDVSARIRMGALNAALMARRAGARTKGFAVVSAELRSFSIGLEGSMLELNAQLARLVLNAAAIGKTERDYQIFERTRRMADGHGGPQLAESCARMAAERARLRAVVAGDWRQLGLRLRQVVRACGGGVALTCSAKIEAVHGQDFAPALAQVADAIEREISSITGDLKLLSELIREEQRKAA
jgi:hypothetical protein